MTGSFDEFVRGAMPVLARYAYLLAGSVPAAEDLLQDTLVIVSRVWRRIDEDGNPVAYVRTVMLRAYLRRWRALRRWPATLPLIDRPGPDVYATVEDRDQVRRLLAELPKDQRAVLVLGYLDGLNDEQIADLLARRPSTVRSIRFRALNTLRRRLTAPQHTTTNLEYR